MQDDGLVKYGKHPSVPPGSACETCHRATPDPVADHCHAHGWVRGNLCRSCNTQMGYVDRGIIPYTGTERLGSLLDFHGRCPERGPLSASDLVPELAWRAADTSYEADQARGAKIAGILIAQVADQAPGSPDAQLAGLTAVMDKVQRKVDELAAERARIFAAVHAAGRSYAQIADAHGMSRARAQQLCEAGRKAAAGAA